MVGWAMFTKLNPVAVVMLVEPVIVAVVAGIENPSHVALAADARVPAGLICKASSPASTMNRVVALSPSTLKSISAFVSLNIAAAAPRERYSVSVPAFIPVKARVAASEAEVAVVRDTSSLPISLSVAPAFSVRKEILFPIPAAAVPVVLWSRVNSVVTALVMASFTVILAGEENIEAPETLRVLESVDSPVTANVELKVVAPVTASVVQNVTAPVALSVPATSRVVEGDVVPIPALPAESILILSLPAVKKRSS